MLKDSLPSLTIMGGIALILMTFTGSQQIKDWSNTTTVAQVVEEFNHTKRIIARAKHVPVETMPEISEEDVLASLGRLYSASDAGSGQHQTLEAAICTQRLPECTHIRVSETDVLDSQTGIQLELRVCRSDMSDWFVGDRVRPGFSVPFEL